MRALCCTISLPLLLSRAVRLRWLLTARRLLAPSPPCNMTRPSRAVDPPPPVLVRAIAAVSFASVTCCRARNCFAADRALGSADARPERGTLVA